MAINARNPFKGRQYPGEATVLCVRWNLRYPLYCEHVSELVAERGVEVDASCIWHWVQAYAPELNKRLKPANKSYRIDETYIKVKGEDKYLYRALDSTGQAIDFLLTARRDTAAARRFLRRTIRRIGQSNAKQTESARRFSSAHCSVSLSNPNSHPTHSYWLESLTPGTSQIKPLSTNIRSGMPSPLVSATWIPKAG